MANFIHRWGVGASCTKHVGWNSIAAYQSGLFNATGLHVSKSAASRHIQEERKAFEAGSSLALLSRPETNVFSLLAEAGKHGPLKERHRRPAAIDDAVFDCDDLDDNTRGPVGAVFPVTM